MNFKRILFLFSIVFISISNIALSQYQWVQWGDLNTSRGAFRAMAINDSEILVMGGESASAYVGNCLNTTEIINTKTKTVSYGPSMRDPRAYFEALYDKDSNIIVLGGNTSYSNFTPIASVEKFNRTTRQWSVLGNMLLPRYQFTSQFINDSIILVVGGFIVPVGGSTSACELFNIKTGVSVYTTSNYPYNATDIYSGISSVGDVLIVGGRDRGPSSIKRTEIYKYNKSSQNFTLASACE